MGKRKRRRIKMRKGQLSLVGPTQSASVDASERPEPRHRVTLLRDHTLKYPELYMEIFVVGPRHEESPFAEMFARSGCSRAKSIETADLVVFTGGVDVDPALYGEERHPQTRFNPTRDQQDITAYKYCLDHGVPMFGVCRGAQFLHVMNGGKLYQHVNHHYGDHTMLDLKTKEIIEKVSSVHHQMVKPNALHGMEILATCTKSKERWLNPKEKEEGTNPDIEAFFYRETCCLGVQGHPEYSGYPYFTTWVLKQIDEYVIMNPDIIWVNSRRRMNPELLGIRDKVNKAIKAEGVKE